MDREKSSELDNRQPRERDIQSLWMDQVSGLFLYPISAIVMALNLDGDSFIISGIEC